MKKGIYYKRIIDEILKNKLEAKGAVLIEGPKWCGKTTSASMVAKSILYMQEPDKVKQNLELAEINPSLLLAGETPRLIDEWQMAPKLWDAIRFEVDKRNEFNQFILTGSSVPANFDEINHSGAGRISRLLMRTMSLYESKDSNGNVSLSNLFDGNEIEGKNDVGIERIAFLICRGGWPKSIDTKDSIALEQSYDYLDAIINIDINKAGSLNHNVNKIRRLLKILSRAVSSQMTLKAIEKDMSLNNDDSLTDETIKKYISSLEKIFVIEKSSAWNPNLRSKTAIRTSDTWYFVDPSIATASLGVGPIDLINDLNTMGLLFENLCIRDLRVYAEFLNGNVFHYRDKTGLECDAVIHLRNGKYGLVEIKLGGEKLIEEAVNTLNKFEKSIDIKKMNEPSFKMILVGVGDYAYKRKDGIYIVPITCLKN